MNYSKEPKCIYELRLLLDDAIKGATCIEFHSHLMNHLADILVNFKDLLEVMDLANNTPAFYPYLTQSDVAHITCFVWMLVKRIAHRTILQQHDGLWRKEGIILEPSCNTEAPLYPSICNSYQNMMFNKPVDDAIRDWCVYDKDIDWMAYNPARRPIAYIPEHLRDTSYMNKYNIPSPTHTHPTLYKTGEEPTTIEQPHPYNSNPYFDRGYYNWLIDALLRCRSHKMHVRSILENNLEAVKRMGNKRQLIHKPRYLSDNPSENQDGEKQ